MLEGTTNFIPFNPATTLVEWRYTVEQPWTDGEYYIRCYLYTAVSDGWVGYGEVYYSLLGGKITNSNVIFTQEGGVCYDHKVLESKEADLVTVDMTSHHVFTINNTTREDFAGCPGYQDWIPQYYGSITRMKMMVACLWCDDVGAPEFRLRYKNSKFYTEGCKDSIYRAPIYRASFPRYLPRYELFYAKNAI